MFASRAVTLWQCTVLCRTHTYSRGICSRAYSTREKKNPLDEDIKKFSKRVWKTPTPADSDQFRLASAVLVERMPFCLPIIPFLNQLDELEDRFELEKERPYKTEEFIFPDMSKQKKDQDASKDKGKGKKGKGKGKEAAAAAAAAAAAEESSSQDKADEDTTLQFRSKKVISYTPASRFTPDDQAKNRRSLMRRVDEPLYLLVKKRRHAHAWQFPQLARQQEETMRQAADRALPTLVGANFEAFIHGNAPAHFFKYIFDSPDPDGLRGCKVFFYRALYVKGEITHETLGHDVEDFAWVAKDEMHEYLHATLLDATQPLLMDLRPPGMDLAREPTALQGLGSAQPSEAEVTDQKVILRRRFGSSGESE